MAVRAEANGISGVATRWMILGEWRAHPGRVIVAALAIAVGVALGFAVHLINASALNEFDRAVATINGDADLQVHATTPLGFDEALYPKVARLDGIADASPAIELATVAGGRTSLTLVGLDPLRAAAVTPSLVGRRANSTRGGAQADPFDPSAAFLSQAALDTTGKNVGDTIELTAAGRTVAFTIAGVLPRAAEGQRIAVIDIAAAQWQFGAVGRLQRIDLKLAEGADAARVLAALATILPPDALLATRETEARRSDSLSRAYRVNLDMLAMVALITGAFLVYSAQSLSIARRRPQFALLRVLGVTRRALVTQVLVEGAVVGCVGAFAGLALGLAAADAALRFIGGDLGSGYFDVARPELIFAPGAALAFLSLGLFAALLGSLLPAREAAGAQPAVALKNAGDIVDPTAVPGAWLALVLLAGGVCLALLPAIDGLPLFGYLSIGLMLAGGIAAMPWLARILLARLQGRVAGIPVIDLALKRLWGAPSQAAIALCGIVASTSLMVAMAVMVSSFRAAVDDWMVQILPDDVYVHVDAGNSAGLETDVQRRWAAIPGVAVISFLKMTPLLLSPERSAVILIARPMNRADPAKSLPLIGGSRDAPAGATPVWVSEPAAWIYGYRRGDVISLPMGAIGAGGGETKVFVGGIWRDYARQYGAIAMDGADYTRLTGDTSRTEASVVLAPGASFRVVTDALRGALPQQLAQRVNFEEPRELRARALKIFDRSFAVTYLLEAVAILVGLAGVAASFSAQTLARTKEFGMLRHLGVLRRQVVAMLVAEGALLGAIGVVVGIGLGVMMSQVLIHVVNPQSFHWTMETHFPLAFFTQIAAAMIAAAAVTALLAGQRALSSSAVRAVQEDW